MMQHNFYIALKVEVLHSYFEDEICNCLQFNSNPATEQVLKRFNLRIRKLTNGFELQTNSNSMANLLVYITRATGISSFDFDITTTDENFKIFTDLPINWIGQMQYDSRSTLNTQDQNVVTLGATLVDEIYTTKLGMLTIHFEELIKRSLQNESTFFRINYKARSTQWQYYIINKSLIRLNNPKIIGKSGIEFQGPKSTTVATGEQALLFSSYENLIPLSRLPIYKFDLVDEPVAAVNDELAQKNIGIKTIVKGLPNPKVAQIGSVKDEIKLVSSPMYVYV